MGQVDGRVDDAHRGLRTVGRRLSVDASGRRAAGSPQPARRDGSAAGCGRRPGTGATSGAARPAARAAAASSARAASLARSSSSTATSATIGTSSVGEGLERPEREDRLDRPLERVRPDRRDDVTGRDLHHRGPGGALLVGVPVGRVPRPPVVEEGVHRAHDLGRLGQVAQPLGRRRPGLRRDVLPAAVDEDEAGAAIAELGCRPRRHHPAVAVTGEDDSSPAPAGRRPTRPAPSATATRSPASVAGRTGRSARPTARGRAGRRRRCGPRRRSRRATAVQAQAVPARPWTSEGAGRARCAPARPSRGSGSARPAPARRRTRPARPRDRARATGAARLGGGQVHRA